MLDRRVWLKNPRNRSGQDFISDSCTTRSHNSSVSVAGPAIRPYFTHPQTPSSGF